MKSKVSEVTTESKNKAEELEKLFRTAKLNFGKAYLITDSGEWLNYTFDINPTDFLRFAKQNNETSDIEEG